jgi:fatty acid desaturase
MATADSPVRSLDDPEFKAALQRLRRTDNLTNWWYILRTYLYLAVVIASAVWVFELARADTIHWVWTIPTALLAVVLVGAGQHQLSGLAHEGVHHILFRHRLLNDLASDLLTMFPLFSAIHLYRLQHLAHHQFVNDPDRDPDVSQLRTSGHWLDFPVTPRRFVGTLARQLWVPKLIRFMRIRARYNATGGGHSPYYKTGATPNRTAVRIGLLYILLLVGTLTGLYYLGDLTLLIAGPVALWVVFSLVFWRLPADRYIQTRLHPVVPARYMTILRIGYITAVFTTLAVLTLVTGAPAALYYAVLWVVPMFTSFSFFMILRQLVQHGNADRGWVTNTRTFLVHRAINFAVFPIGQDYHLPHHMYATVPHYRLPELHELMMRYPDYREQAVVVHGYFLPPSHPKPGPTVLDVLGEEYAARHGQAVHTDDTVMDNDRFEDADEIRAEAERLRKRAG